MYAGRLAAIAERNARIVLDAYERYASGFLDITRRARGRFERREWRSTQPDTRERLDLYQREVDAALAELARGRDPSAEARLVWMRAKRLVCTRVSERRDSELAETFYNSVARRELGTVGVDPDTEFSGPGQLADGVVDRTIFRRYAPAGSLAAMLVQCFRDSGFALRDPSGDARRAAQDLERQFTDRGARAVEWLDLLAEPWRERRGDGVVQPEEVCDGDGCSSDCRSWGPN